MEVKSHTMYSMTHPKGLVKLSNALLAERDNSLAVLFCNQWHVWSHVELLWERSLLKAVPSACTVLRTCSPTNPSPIVPTRCDADSGNRYARVALPGPGCT